MASSPVYSLQGVRGSGRTIVWAHGEPIDVHWYRPPVETRSGGLMLFDGMYRDAASLRDKAIELADRLGRPVFAPLLDAKRFPKWRYDRAGIFRHRELQDREHWTQPLLQELVDWANQVSGDECLRVTVMGHSAGGQMISRVCAYSPLHNVHRFVISNPSSYVVPKWDEKVPYGFGQIFDRKMARRMIKAYLSAPISIYVGANDTGSVNLSRSSGAMRQGVNRLERARKVYREAIQVARRLDVRCQWRLIEADDAGHSSRAMLKAAQVIQALDPN